MIKDGSPELRTPDEQMNLATLVAMAPGAGMVKVCGWHPRGGYVVFVDVEPDCLEALLQHVFSSGWRPVM